MNLIIEANDYDDEEEEPTQSKSVSQSESKFGFWNFEEFFFSFFLIFPFFLIQVLSLIRFFFVHSSQPICMHELAIFVSKKMFLMIFFLVKKVSR